MSTHLITSLVLVLATAASADTITLTGFSETLSTDGITQPTFGSFGAAYHTRSFVEFDVAPGGGYTSAVFELTIMPNFWPPSPQPFDLPLSIVSIPFTFNDVSLGGVGDINGTLPVGQDGDGAELFSAPISADVLNALNTDGRVGLSGGLGGSGPAINGISPTLILTSSDPAPLPRSVYAVPVLLAIFCVRKGMKRWTSAN